MIPIPKKFATILLVIGLIVAALYIGFGGSLTITKYQKDIVGATHAVKVGVIGLEDVLNLGTSYDVGRPITFTAKIGVRYFDFSYPDTDMAMQYNMVKATMEWPGGSRTYDLPSDNLPIGVKADNTLTFDDIPITLPIIDVESDTTITVYIAASMKWTWKTLGMPYSDWSYLTTIGNFKTIQKSSGGTPGVTGNVVVNTELGGVVVSLTGAQTSTKTSVVGTPLFFDNMLIGEYTATLSKTGYLQQVQSFTLTISGKTIYNTPWTTTTPGVNQPPVAIITITSWVGKTVTVSGSQSYDPDGTIVTYYWEIGATKYYTAEATHTFPSDGVYTVRLVVRDDKTTVTSATRDIEIKTSSVAPTPPTAQFSYTIDNFTVAYDGTKSLPIGDAFTYSWAFGDGEISSEAKPTHIYTAVKEYTVTLTITDADGLTGTVTQTVKVTGLPGPTDETYSWSQTGIIIAAVGVLGAILAYAFIPMPPNVKALIALIIAIAALVAAHFSNVGVI